MTNTNMHVHIHTYIVCTHMHWITPPLCAIFVSAAKLYIYAHT